MPVADQSNNPAEVEKWLKARGFSRGNPFRTTSADEERQYLSEELFVPVGDYDRVRSNQTVIVFAPRGGGKSALRIRLAAISLPQKADAKTLAVECTDFGWLVKQYRDKGSLVEGDYAEFLLRQAAMAFFNVFFSPNTFLDQGETHKDRQHRLMRAADLAAVDRSEMAAILRRHAPHLLTASTLYRNLERLSPNFFLKWPDFRKAIEERDLHSKLQDTALARNPVAVLLADLLDEPEVEPDSYASWLDQFEELVILAESAGISCIHFLVDRLDEMQLFANDHEAQADFLQPLLAYLRLLELPGVAFKFFLAQELRQVLANNSSVRRDRLLNKAITLRWDMDKLTELLRNRLLFFSEGQVESLTLLCREEGEAVEKELLDWAHGSPRRLLTGAQLLCEVHVSNEWSQGLLTLADWRTAKEKLLQLMPSMLLLRLDEHLVEVAGKEVKLSKQEAHILQILADNEGGYCEREELVKKVWGGVTTDQAIDAAFKRLRSKIGDDGEQPVYLQTLRGKRRGFRLQYFELSG